MKIVRWLLRHAHIILDDLSISLTEAAADEAPLRPMQSCSRCDSEAKTVVQTRSLQSAQVQGLSDEIMAHVAAFLDTPSLVTLTRCLACDSPMIRTIFNERVKLCLPPDSTRGDCLLPLLEHANQNTPTNFMLADGYHLHLLHKIRSCVRSIELDIHRYMAMPESPFEYNAISKFPNLVRLEVGCARVQPIDLAFLSKCAPQLQSLVLKRTERLFNAFYLPELRELRLALSNITSLTVVKGSRKLKHLTMFNWSSEYLRDADALEALESLETLCVFGKWEEDPHHALRKRRHSLRTYNHIGPHSADLYPLPYASLTELRTLRIGSYPVKSLRPLTNLRFLEHLQIVLDRSGSDCTLLRRLRSLSHLEIEGGRVGDFLGYLPNLCKLAVIKRTSWADFNAIERFEQRHNDVDGFRDNTSWQGLQELVIGGKIMVDENNKVVEAWLHPLRQIEFIDMVCDDVLHSWLKIICRLPHIKRFSMRGCYCE